MSRGTRSFGSLVLIGTVAASVPTGHRPAATAHGAPRTAPLHGTLVATNMNDNTATVIDLATRRTLATLATGMAPHEVAISHDGRWAVVSNYGPRATPGNSLTVIDLAAPVPVVTRTIDLGQYQRPHGSAFLPGDATLLVTAQVNQSVVAVNFARGTIDTVIPTTQRGTHMLALTADGRRAFTTNFVDSTISQLDIEHHAFVRTIHVAPSVEGIAVTPSGDQVWVGSNKAKTVSIINVATGAIADTIGGFGLPYRMAITPDGRTAIITDPAAALIRFVNTATRAELGRVAFAAEDVVPTAEFPGSPCPEGLVVTPDSRTVYVTLQGRNLVAAVDIATRTIVATMPTGVWSDGVAYSPLAHR
jgi:YVTN family beta-propeller protein